VRQRAHDGGDLGARKHAGHQHAEGQLRRRECQQQHLRQGSLRLSLQQPIQNMPHEKLMAFSFTAIAHSDACLQLSIIKCTLNTHRRVPVRRQVVMMARHITAVGFADRTSSSDGCVFRRKDAQQTAVTARLTARRMAA